MLGSFTSHILDLLNYITSIPILKFDKDAEIITEQESTTSNDSQSEQQVEITQTHEPNLTTKICKKQDDSQNCHEKDNADEDDDDDDDDGDDDELYPGEEDISTFKSKVIQLCLDIGYPVPTQVDDLAKGSSNRAISLRFDDHENADCVLRVAMLPYTDGDKDQLMDQIAVLVNLGQHDFLGAPKVLAHDVTTENAIGCQWLLLSRIPGVSLLDVYYQMPIAEKLSITRQVADILIKMRGIKFDNPGKLTSTRDLPLRSKHAISADLSECAFEDDIGNPMPVLHKQPLRQMLKTLFSIRKEQYPEGMQDLRYRKFNILEDVCDWMNFAKLYRKQDSQKCILWHWDLEPRNIMVQRRTKQATKHDETSEDSWVITGILDWDDVHAVPEVLTRAPPTFLWFGDDAREEISDFWDGNNDTKPHRQLKQDELLVKAYFDQIMAVAVPCYFDDTYGRGIWLRGIAYFALKGIGGSEDYVRYNKLLTEWNDYLESFED